MSLSDSINFYINHFAPLLVGIGILCVAADYIGWKIPWVAIAKFLGWVFVFAGLLTFAGVIVLILQRMSTGEILAVWLVVGLPVYLVRWYQATAEARAEWKARLRQARHHERRRAPPPLPHGTQGGTQFPSHIPTAPRSHP